MSDSKTYTCWGVESGDRLTLISPSASGPPEYKQVLLQYINAPKLARKLPDGSANPDEPCAFEAAEFMRKAALGKQVKFVDGPFIDAISRTSGRMFLADGMDAAVQLLRAGLATINVRPPPGMPAPLHDEYLAHMTSAKNSKVGIHAIDAVMKVRDFKPFPPTAPETLAGALKGQQTKARVDRVQSGASLLVTLCSTEQQLQCCFSGINCPNAREEIGVMAKYHTEKFLLNREITFLWEGLDQFGNFLASVVSPKTGATFQEELLAKGLAKVVSATLASQSLGEKYRQLERDAQNRRCGVWTNHVPAQVVGAGGAAAAGEDPMTTYSGEQQFSGTVVQAISGDTLVVRNDKMQCIRMTLAGIRANRVIKRDSEFTPGDRPPEIRSSHEQFTWEAKEYIRKRFIGKQVNVLVEYVKKLEGGEHRPAASVVETDSNTNIGLELVKQGLAKFFLGRGDTVSNEPQLQLAEAEAREARKGMHSDKEPPATKVVELNRLGEKKAKFYLQFLQRGMVGTRPPTWQGHCEMVMSASSFRVYIPKEHLQITLKLAGVITPSGGVNGEPVDAFAVEARDFSIMNVQGREVSIEVENVDKAGNFIGKLTLGTKNFAAVLAEQGLATVSSGGRVIYINELLSAEKRAKDAKKNIWSTGAIPARQLKQQEAMAKNAPSAFVASDEAGKYSPCEITDVVSATSVYMRPMNAAAKATLAAVKEAAAGLTRARHEPERNEKDVLAYFRADKSWNRARIVSVNREYEEVSVVFSDFGTRDTIPFKDIQPMPKDVAALNSAPLAFLANVAFVRPLPETSEFSEEAGAVILEYVGLECEYAVQYTESVTKQKYVDITCGPGEDTVAEALVRTGLGVIDDKAKALMPKKVTKLASLQEQALRERKGLWRYGTGGVAAMLDGEEED